MQSEQIDKLATALSKAQAVMEAAAKNKRNPHFNSAYADLASIIESVRKPLTDNGLAFTQTIQTMQTGLSLETTLLHTSGQWLRSEYPLIQGTAQQTGSSLTYARRYSLSSIAGIAADEDDDANAATQANGKHPQRKAPKEVTPLKAPEPDADPTGDTIDQQQLDDLIACADDVGADRRKMCRHYGVAALADMTVGQYHEAMAQLERKRETIEAGNAQGDTD